MNPEALARSRCLMSGWGTEFVDFDADGWLDLVVANGNTLEFERSTSQEIETTGVVSFSESAWAVLS